MHIKSRLFLISFFLLLSTGISFSENAKDIRNQYYANGQLKFTTQFLADGSVENKFYFDNGQLSSETVLTKDYQNVHQKEYNKKGVLLKEFVQIDGKQIKNEFYCNEKMEQVFVRWFPTTKGFSVKNFRVLASEISLNDQEIGMLKSAGLTGNFEIQGSRGLGRECQSSRVIFIFQKLIESPVELNLPQGGSAIYVQKNDGWLKLPKDSKVLDRKIRFELYSSHPGSMLESSELEHGGTQGGSINLGF